MGRVKVRNESEPQREAESLGGFQVQEQLAGSDPGTQKEHILRSFFCPAFQEDLGLVSGPRVAQDGVPILVGNEGRRLWGWAFLMA